MALTGDPGGPPLAPPTDAAAAVDEALRPFGLDAAVLAERAASAGLARGGRASCGGGSRLLPTATGWLALTLSRPDDVATLPALLETDVEDAGSDAPVPWAAVAAGVAARDAHELADRAGLLGVPAGVVGGAAGPGGLTVEGRQRPGGRRPRPAPPPLVVDLSALWAGPLAASCLLRAGATVVKVEDPRRPDGSRRGDPAFHDLLNGGKRSVALDLSSPDGSAALGALVDRADVVVTAGRARAIAGLGLDPAVRLAGATDKVWVAVTAYGWASDRVGFGDDAAATAGLVAWHPADGEPRFAGDAVADPLCGALAARAALDTWARGGRWFVDASLAGAARSVVRPGPARAAAPDGLGGWEVDGEPVAAPRPRRAKRAAVPLGADTATVLAGVSA
jgi:CoA-transferase family III